MLPREIERGSPEFGVLVPVVARPRNAGIFRGVICSRAVWQEFNVVNEGRRADLDALRSGDRVSKLA